jgi:hypothetical protein
MELLARKSEETRRERWERSIKRKSFGNELLRWMNKNRLKNSEER